MKQLWPLLFLLCVSLGLSAQIKCPIGSNVVELNDGFLMIDVNSSKGKWTVNLKKLDKELKEISNYTKQFEFKSDYPIQLTIPVDESYFYFSILDKPKKKTAYTIWLDDKLNELSSGQSVEEILDEKGKERILRTKDYLPFEPANESSHEWAWKEPFYADVVDRRIRTEDHLFELRYRTGPKGYAVVASDYVEYKGETQVRGFKLNGTSGLESYDLEWSTNLPFEGEDISDYIFKGVNNGKLHLLIEAVKNKNRVVHLLILRADDGEIVDNIQLFEEEGERTIITDVNVSETGDAVVLCAPYKLMEYSSIVLIGPEGEIKASHKINRDDYEGLYNKANDKKVSFSKNDVLMYSSGVVKFTESGFYYAIPVYYSLGWSILGLNFLHFDNSGELIEKGFVTGSKNDFLWNNMGIPEYSLSKIISPAFYCDFTVDGDEINLISRFRRGFYDGPFASYQYVGQIDELMLMDELERTSKHNFYMPKDMRNVYRYEQGEKGNAPKFKVIASKK